MQGLDVLVGGRLVEPGVEQQLLDALVTGDALVRDARPGTSSRSRGRRWRSCRRAARPRRRRTSPCRSGRRRSRRARRRPRRHRRTRPCPRRASRARARPSGHGCRRRARRQPSGLRRPWRPLHATGTRCTGPWGTPFVGGSPSVTVGARALHQSSGGPPSMPVAKSPSLSFSGESGNSSTPSLNRPLCSTSISGPWRTPRAKSDSRSSCGSLLGAFGKPVIRLIRLRRMRVFCVSFHAYGLPKADPENSGRGRFTKPSESAHSIVRANVSRTGV